MKCEHNNCETCPYPDCISDVEVEPERKKKGRKKLSREEKLRRKRIRSIQDYYKNQDYWHKRYVEKTKGTVNSRYKSKLNKEIV